MGFFTRSKSISPARTVKIVRKDAPAVSRGVVLEKGGVSLAKNFDNVGEQLGKRGLNGVRAEAVMLLDHSGSMSRDYQNGNVHTLVERALAFALQVDADGKIPVIRFDSLIRREVEVTASNLNGIMGDLYDPRGMGTTDLTGALKALLKIAKSTDSPIFAVVITDGEPNDRVSATELVVELARYPVFLKFISIAQVQYLKTLDEMEGRLVDNANAQFIRDPRQVSEADFASKMLDEWDKWFREAEEVGLLTSS